MFNGNYIKNLLSERKIQNKDLLKFLGCNPNSSIRRITDGNPSADRLEKLADFFNVSIDSFFTRENPSAQEKKDEAIIDHLYAEVDLLKKLVEEKDKRISMLEASIKHSSNRDNIGTLKHQI